MVLIRDAKILWFLYIRTFLVIPKILWSRGYLDAMFRPIFSLVILMFVIIRLWKNYRVLIQFLERLFVSCFELNCKYPLIKTNDIFCVYKFRICSFIISCWMSWLRKYKHHALTNHLTCPAWIEDIKSGILYSRGLYLEILLIS